MESLQKFKRKQKEGIICKKRKIVDFEKFLILEDHMYPDLNVKECCVTRNS